MEITQQTTDGSAGPIYFSSLSSIRVSNDERRCHRDVPATKGSILIITAFLLNRSTPEHLHVTAAMKLFDESNVSESSALHVSDIVAKSKTRFELQFIVQTTLKCWLFE
jgi:hypothetical protein